MPFSGYGDLDPRFAGALQAFIAANPGLAAFSGYRTPERQAQLFAASDQSGHMVGSPRGSYHVKRQAADLNFNGARLSALPRSQIEALHQSAGTFGLKFPMSWEPWHVEPAYTRGGLMAGGGALPSFVNAGAIGMNGADYAGAPMPTSYRLTSPVAMADQPPAIGTEAMPMPWDQFGPGYLPAPMEQAGAPPMTPERFIMGMIAGENPLRRMVFGKLSGLFA